MNAAKKQNILVVHNYYQISGGEDTVISNEIKMLEEHGHKVVLYTRKNSELNKMSKVQKLVLPFLTVFNPRTYKEIKRLIREQHIDIVHVHNTLTLISPSVYYAAISCKVPVVQTVHNFRLLCPGATYYRDGHICEDCVSQGLWCAIKHRCYRGSMVQTLACVINTLIHRMTGIYKKINYIALTEFNKQKLLELKQIESKKIFVKPNFTFKNPVKHQEGDYYLFIGRIEPIKGLDVLIQAFAKMPERKLIIVGTGTHFDHYTNLVQQLDVGNITFTGFLKREEINHLLSRAKAVVVTSQWYETFGMIIVEAFSSSVPVISGDIGNIGILVEQGITGEKFVYNDSSSLIEAVKRFEKREISVLGENAYLEYKKKYTPEANYNQLMDIYESLT